MQKQFPNRRVPQASEEGYVLLAVIFMLALLMISLTVAAPAIKREIQRDREVETMQRGRQYIRAIKLYYKKFGAYPPNVDALVKTNEIRFLRKKYIDPTTGKDEWKPIHFGQNKAPTAMGFFGQPLTGSTLAGTGPMGGNSGLNGSAASGSPFGSQSNNSNMFSSTTPTTNTTTTTGTTGNSPNSTTGTDSSGSSTGLTGQTFGGGGIIGFSPGSPKQSILVYKKKNHYNEWEFVYDPLSEQMTISGGNANTIGQPASSTTTPIGSSGIGSPTSGTPNTGITPTPQTPTTPQQ